MSAFPDKYFLTNFRTDMQLIAINLWIGQFGIVLPYETDFIKIFYLIEHQIMLYFDKTHKKKHSHGNTLIIINYKS